MLCAVFFVRIIRINYEQKRQQGNLQPFEMLYKKQRQWYLLLFGKVKIGGALMKDFPDFMKVESNHIDTAQQNTKDIDGYYYIANNGHQMAFWTCYEDRVSAEHCHDFDEYMV